MMRPNGRAFKDERVTIMAFGLTKKELSWVLYDVGNSAFVMLSTALIPVYFASIADPGSSVVVAWGYAETVASLVLALLMPVLGSLADLAGNKKKFLVGFAGTGAVACAALGIPEHALVFLVVYVIAAIMLNGSMVFYDAFLVDATTEERYDKVSSHGYAWGYIGSCIPFIACLAVVLGGSSFGIDAKLGMKIAFIITAVWWVIFTVPVAENVKQLHGKKRSDHVLRTTISGLKGTVKSIMKDKRLLFFMLAFFFYIDGVNTVIHMSTSYGDTLGLDSTSMLLALLLVQVLGLPFCLMYIKLAGKFGARVMVGVGICIYMGICVFGFFVRETWQFWVLAILVATSQGGIQALSRSMFGKMLPDKNRSGEYFGFFDIFGKFSSVMGPALMGFVTQIATVVLLGRQSLTPETAPEAVLAAAQQEASPWGVLSVLLIFLVGAVLYFGVLPRMLKKEGAGK